MKILLLVPGGALRTVLHAPKKSNFVE